jgi:hypothetical protein
MKLNWILNSWIDLSMKTMKISVSQIIMIFQYIIIQNKQETEKK